MAHALIAKLRKAREIKVVIGTFTFTVRRPTDAEMLAINQSGLVVVDMAMRGVIDWDGVAENDIIGGGVITPLPFDADLWIEWCRDRPDFWPPIANAALEAYQKHAEALESAAKN